MAIEIVDFHMKNGGSFHCYVGSPEGKPGEFPYDVTARIVKNIG